MEADYGKLSMKEILAPAIAMANGYPIAPMDDLGKWQVHIEEALKTSYRGVDVYS